jgi:hypothetical protein
VENKDPETETPSVNLYNNGTVVVQGNFIYFQKDFHRINERARQEKTRNMTAAHIPRL